MSYITYFYVEIQNNEIAYFRCPYFLSINVIQGQQKNIKTVRHINYVSGLTSSPMSRQVSSRSMFCMGEQNPSSVHMVAVEVRIHREWQADRASFPSPFSVARWAGPPCREEDLQKEDASTQFINIFKISHFLITVHFLYLLYTSMAKDHLFFKIKYNYHYLVKLNGTSLVDKV